MGRRETPSVKDRDRVFSLLKSNSVCSTGSPARLAGKIAAMLNLSIVTVRSVLKSELIALEQLEDGVWMASIRPSRKEL